MHQLYCKHKSSEHRLMFLGIGRYTGSIRYPGIGERVCKLEDLWDIYIGRASATSPNSGSWRI